VEALRGERAGRGQTDRGVRTLRALTGFAMGDWLRFALRNFIRFGLTGLRLTLGALAELRGWRLEMFRLVFAPSGALMPSAITKVNSSALNFIRLFYC
jgi:hypothetical protein